MTAEFYLRTLSKYIPDSRVREEVIREYEDHLEDSVEYLMARGMFREEAEEEAIRQMGDPKKAGKEMRKVYSNLFDVRMLLFFLGIGVGLCIILIPMIRMITGGNSLIVHPGDSNDRIYLIASNGLGILFVLFGFIWSAVEKWRDYDLFYAWGKYWHGGGITNSAVFMLIGIALLSLWRGVQWIGILVPVMALLQFLQRAAIEWYRSRKKEKLLWEIGIAKTAVFPYQGKGQIGGKTRNIVSEGEEKFPAGWPFMVVGIEGMTPVVQKLDPSAVIGNENHEISEETRKLLEDGAQMGTEVPKERSAYWYLARSILLIALAIAVFWAVIYGLILYGQ